MVDLFTVANYQKLSCGRNQDMMAETNVLFFTRSWWLALHCSPFAPFDHFVKLSTPKSTLISSLEST